MKKILIALALCLLMVTLIATPAFAATTRVPLIRYLIGSDETTPIGPAGYATFITNQGDNELVINVTIKGALQRTQYNVYLLYALKVDVDQNGTSYLSSSTPAELGSLTTNSKGNWGGQNQQYSFEYVLPPGTYYVAICSWDADRNLSRLSNVVKVKLP